MVGWDYQHTGNPVYSVENHVEQVNNALAARPDVIITELESVGLVPVFQAGQQQGVTMVITDQGVEDEASKLGLNIINQDEFAAGVINGTQAPTWAQKLTGSTSGMIVFGNGNPGATSIDKRQTGSKQGIEQYNAANGTTYQFDAFADSSFDDESQSIQKYEAQIDKWGDQLVGLITGGNAVPIEKAMQDRGLSPGKFAVGTTDVPPAHQQALAGIRLITVISSASHRFPSTIASGGWPMWRGKV
jgi:ABC-type sugar transport system substrate-binding protein